MSTMSRSYLITIFYFIRHLFEQCITHGNEFVECKKNMKLSDALTKCNHSFWKLNNFNDSCANCQGWTVKKPFLSTVSTVTDLISSNFSMNWPILSENGAHAMCTQTWRQRKEEDRKEECIWIEGNKPNENQRHRYSYITFQNLLSQS